jgi:hypothetical protein
MLGEIKMKKTTITVMICVLLLTLFMTGANAEDRKKIGLGVIAGEPTGLTGKFMFNNTTGIDAGVGWKTSGDNEFHIYGDYLYHLYDILRVPQGQLPLYFGAGLRYVEREKKDNKFGVRIPLGIEYLFENISLGAFFELVPILNLTPDTEFDLEAGIGIRFFF